VSGGDVVADEETRRADEGQAGERQKEQEQDGAQGGS